jgi:hypothetical protein
MSRSQKNSPSVRSLRELGSAKSASFSLISAAISVLPAPSLPWDMAQSTVHNFLARARDSGEDFTGLACLAASAGMES